jgi:transposase
MRYHAGERSGWSVVRVPSVAEEDARRLHRKLERLKRERASHQCRMQALLVTQGIRAKVDAGFGRRLQTLKLWDGSALPQALKGELQREHERLKLLEGRSRH